MSEKQLTSPLSVEHANNTSVLGIQADVLELIAQRTPVETSLSLLCKRAEELVGDCLGSVMILNSDRSSLYVLAAPSFPQEAIDDFNGLVPGPRAGSCGTTVYTGELTIVQDVLNDERWCDIQHLAHKYNIGACWSFPICFDGELLGSFALTSFSKREPTDLNRTLLQTAANLAGFAIDQARADDRLLHSDIAFENTSEGIIIADKNGRIFRTNSAFHKISGFEKQEMTPQPLLEVLVANQSTRKVIDAVLKRKNSWRGEAELPTKNGDSVPALLNITVVRDNDDNVSQYVAVISDISRIKKSQDQLEHLAHHDPLTGLSNRLAFETLLKQYLQENCSESSPIALMFIDLDNFKTINDAQGHATGDRLLQLVGARIRHCIRDEDLIARFGGDEFTLMLPYQELDTVEQCAKRLINELGKSYEIDNRDYFSSASIGIALAPADGTNIEDLIQNADAAMYKAKRLGRNCHSYYCSELTSKVKRKLLLESSLRKALDDDELFLVFQPQFDTQHRITSVETLLRWESNEHGTVSPTEFIPVAEDAGLIHRIGSWVLRNACIQARCWSDAGLPPMNVSVNVSLHQLDADFCELVQETLHETRLNPQLLQLEITESTVMDQVEHGFAVLENLRSLGVSLAIDDFGAGYSSLGHLKKLPVNALKIDRSLVQDLPDEKNDMAIISAVVALGHALDMTVIAEGVETEGQLSALKQIGCDQFQGYFLGKPMPVNEVAELLRTSERLLSTTKKAS